MNHCSRILLALAAFLATAAPMASASPQESVPPAPQPSTQQQEPPPSQKVQGADVKNMPGYKTENSTTQTTQPAPNPTQQMPTPDQKVTNGPPATVPLPPPPPLPVAAPAPYVQNPQAPAQPPYKPQPSDFVVSAFGSTYIPLDSWIYPAMLRLYSMGYLDTAFIGMRPWTRLSALHMLSLSADKIDAQEPDDSQARQIYEALREELENPTPGMPGKYPGEGEIESVYTRVGGINGPSLNILDSYSVGQTLVNDYGRPYAAGFNNVSGFSTRAAQGRFSFYLRGEYLHAGSWTGYNTSQTEVLQHINENDYVPVGPLGVPTLTVPMGTVSGQDRVNILEADLAVHVLGHEISIGKHDEWLGPNEGGAFGYTNNAEANYAFKINRVEPLYIPLISKLLGPVRYQGFVGSLKGHSVPNDPWIHSETFSFRPSENFEFGFTRDVIWGGKDHEGVSFKTFFHSFFSTGDTTPYTKCLVISENPPNPPPGYPPPHLTNCEDPGARFSAFDYSYRLPGLRKWLTWTVDSFVHDDVTPISAPRRSAYRTGLYLSHFPGAAKLDLRVEAVNTDPSTNASVNGSFMYWETVQHEGITSKGVIFGDAIGREDKGGRAWLTYHLSPSEYLQVDVRNTKAARDFIPGGTTQWDYGFRAVKRLAKDVELKGLVQFERYNIPFLKPGVQNDTTFSVQATWFPKMQKQF